MATQQPAELKFRRGDGMYVVMLGDERIGFVERQGDGGWKAVDTYMAWTQRYKTRARAGNGLWRHHVQLSR